MSYSENKKVILGEFLPPTLQQQIEYLESEVLRLQKQLSELSSINGDSILLDYLNDLPDIPPGYGWKLYKSTTGRGWRLATISQFGLESLHLTPDIYATPREAIQAEIEAEKEE